MTNRFSVRAFLDASRRFALTLPVLFLLGWHSLSAQTISGTNWFPIGPADLSNGQTYGDGRVNVAGRATVIAVNPSNTNDIWLGTATGGVWHSTNGGVNWLPMSDNEASLSIGAIALDGCSASGCTTIYAGTGENSIRRDTYYGMGLLVGQTSGGEFPAFGWSLKGATPFKFASINNVLVQDSGRTIYVSLSSGVTASATESTVTAPDPPGGFGIYKSIDSGTNWTKLTIPGTNGAKPTDLERDPTNNNVMYAGFMGRGIFKTTNGGTNWCPLDPGIALPPGCAAASGLPNPTTTTFDHVEIAIDRPNAATPAVLYAIFGNCPDPIGNGPVLGGSCSPPIFKSTNDGSTWTQTNATGPSSYSRYTHALAIDPGNSSTILYGGLQLFKSTDSGTTFTGLGNNVHPDHHTIVFADPANSNRLYDTSDGGFASSSNGGVSWTSGNSDLQITGFQSVSSSPLTARIIGGTQDNGTEMWVGTRVWEHRDDGDSASSVMDLDDLMKMYDVYFSVDPRRSTDGGTCCSWPGILNGLNTSDPSAVYPALTEEPSPPHALYFGSNKLYKTSDKGNSWNAISPVLGGTTPVFPDIQRSNVITAIAVAPSNANRIYIGYYDGQIFVTDAACTTIACWRAIGGAAKGLPAAPVTRIAVDPGSADLAYATFSGFGSGPHLFKTANGGTSWSASATGLPVIPANTINLETSSILWAGTDDGVYKSVNSGATWDRFGFGLPHVPVYEITIDRTRGRLYAGTHGRGVYILTRPFLSNFEGWVAGDIWDIPVYGTGFVGTVANPVGSACTMQIIQRDGTLCSSSTTDVMGGNISFDSSGQLVTSRGGFWNGKPVAWACYNGNCIGGRTIAACNPPSNPITSVVVTCGTQVGIDHILGCPAQANPPSSVLGLSGMPGTGSGFLATTILAADAIPAATTFDLIPTIQGRDGTRALCSARVTLNAGDTPAQALVKARDAVNADPGCLANTVTALVTGVPPEPPRGEDLDSSPASLTIRAPSAVGGQLFTSLRAAPGAATNSCFNVSGIGSPLQNQVAVMKVEFDTSAGGAAGGTISIVERSPLGSCTVTVRTDPGESAAQIATAIANAFQAPGTPGPDQCPAIQNPRDITVDGSSIVSVLASELRVCNNDRDLGFFLAPKELPNARRLTLQYAAKFVCGEPGDGLGRSSLASGHYYTMLNIHNPTDKTIAFRYKVATISPNGQPGPISKYFDAELGPDQVMSIGCGQMVAFLPHKLELVDGFVVVESETDLDVIAVYTAAGTLKKVESLKVERIPARLR